MQVGNLHHSWKLRNDFWYNAIWHTPGLATLWNACLKWHTERLPWQVAFTVVPIFFISFAHPLSLYCEENV